MTALVRVAMPAPLRRAFDYRVPDSWSVPAPGTRVRAPFGRRERIGIVLERVSEPAVDARRLKALHEVLDQQPLLPPATLRLLTWAADYYHHPVGEALQAAIPVALRRAGAAGTLRGAQRFRLTGAGMSARSASLARAPLQQAILTRLLEAPGHTLDARALRDLSGGWRAAARALQARGWLEPLPPAAAAAAEAMPACGGPELSPAQQAAADAVVSALGGFHPFLLQGVTGSGKTEVYIHAVREVLGRGLQALVLVPEIALTPQLVERFRSRLGGNISVMHSGLPERERLRAWMAARGGEADIVLGTRSAVFTPLARPGLFVIDEEHDSSYKQQDGFRYHARDVAIMRASMEATPVVLGSATPSLESMRNGDTGRFTMLDLPARAGEARMPEVTLVDMRRQPATDGLGPALVDAIRRRLERGEQSLVFINRRGFAPVLVCAQCQWVAGCERCDARMVYHRQREQLRCHHCGAQRSPPTACGHCGSARLVHMGEGTQRVEERLRRLFPAARVLRIDRDSVQGKGELDERLQRAGRGEADILVGTQLLAKGHDFPNVTLVCVLNADQGLFSADFRAPEHLCQQIMQVAGRSGRGALPGQVLVQTAWPDNPWLARVCEHDYRGFAREALAERRESGLPPFAALALLRAESTRADDALAFLRGAREAAVMLDTPGVSVMDAVPAPMERRAGRFRAQLLASSARRADLHALLTPWLEAVAALPGARRVRWSIDVDPVDLF